MQCCVRRRGGKRCLRMSECVFARAWVSVRVSLSVDVRIYPGLTLSLLHFMIRRANGPCIMQSSTRAWMSRRREACHSSPANNPARVSLCGHLCLQARMIARTPWCVWEYFSILVQSVSVINARVHTCKKKPIGSTIIQGGPTFKARQEN